MPVLLFAAFRRCVPALLALACAGVAAQAPPAASAPAGADACRPLSEQAMAADLKAATAQQGREAPAQIGRIHDEAIALWSQAVAACEGRARERAQRNLDDSRNALVALGLAPAVQPQCLAAGKDAQALEVLAEQAQREGRRAEAALLYRKLADVWDAASERCSGAERQAAVTKGEQASRAAAAAAAAAAPAAAPADVAAIKVPPRAAVPSAEFMSSGTRFTGGFKPDSNGKTYSGTGKISWANGDVFEGTLQWGQRQGKGRFAWANGQVYDGDWRDNRPTGSGSMRFANGNQYEGALDDGVPTGKGRMLFASGDSYTGEFLRGVPNGRGTYVWSDGQRFEGEWKDEHPHGTGVLRFANGNVYEGTLAVGQPHGSGRMVYASGDSYTGEFVYGVPEGKGTYAWKNGDRYTGQWTAGAKDGEGVMQWANGDRWEGVFRYDAQTEVGKLIRKAP